MPNFSPTPEGAAIIDAIAAGTSTQVEALAGSGKTTILEQASHKIKRPALAVAFNKKIATELSTRMSARFQCKTMNALGHKALMRKLGYKIELNPKKMGEIVSTLCSTYGLHRKEDWLTITRLADSARNSGVIPEGDTHGGKTLLPDTTETWSEIALHFGLDDDPLYLELAREAVIQSNAQVFDTAPVIDFTDQIYIATLWRAAFERYKIVFVDEAQDLSPIQHNMVASSLALQSQLVCVGDQYQAIYGFRGADASSMTTLRERFKLQSLPLTLSWRVSAAVGAHAQELVPTLRWRPDAPEGSVRALDAWSGQDLAPHSAVLCRNNAPLITLGYRLVKQGIPVNMSLLTESAGLLALIKKLKPKTPADLIEKLDSWFSAEKARYAGRLHLLDKVQDKYESLQSIILHSSPRSVSDVEDAIRMLFSKDRGLPLSSGHKAKGLEWDNVYILDPDRLYPAHATEPWMQDQERNLDYVLRTRAKNNLTYIHMRDML